MEDRELIDWIRLSGTENVGPATFRNLLKRYGSVRNALDALPEIAGRAGKKELNILPIHVAEEQLELARKLNAKLITWSDPEYPTPLKVIDSSPPILFVKGNISLLLNQCFAIVGSRHASLNGINFTQEISSSLGNFGLSIVSGLALGIDAAAHQGALDTGTIAVLGGGLDIEYPKENAQLQSRIAEQGLLISEFMLGAPPAANHFPRRNRIIAGLSVGVLVVEARHQSGSMITANYANEFGRDVFAVPGFPNDPRSEGPNKLILEGAHLVRNASDILECLSSKIDFLCEFDPKEYFPSPGLEVRGLSEMKSKILELLSTTPIDVDEIIQHTSLPPAYVWDVILGLELSGKIQRHIGNKVSLKP
jgi:DNA processing protein